MFIKKFKPGERARETAPCIYIDRLDDGRFSWTGSIDVNGEAVLGGSPGQFATVQEAETDAIAWARGRGATELHIEAPNS